MAMLLVNEAATYSLLAGPLWSSRSQMQVLHETDFDSGELFQIHWKAPVKRLQERSGQSCFNRHQSIMLYSLVVRFSVGDQ